MNVNIIVTETRGLYPDRTNLGTIGENNATTLNFILPENLKSYSQTVAIETSAGSFNFEITGTLTLPSKVLTDESFRLQLSLKDGDRVIWISKFVEFTFNLQINSSGENILDSAIAQARVEFEEDLRQALEAALGADLSDEDWAELLETIEHLGILNNLIAEINQMIDESGVVEYDNSVEA